MARGESGRIVLEIHPSQKDDLYSALTKDGLTLKDWFLLQAAQYLREREQIPLFGRSVVLEEPPEHEGGAAFGSAVKAKSKRLRTKGKSK